MFGIDDALIGAVAGPLIGGLLGGSSGANSATTSQQNQIDPRMAPYLYGGGTGGLMGSVNNLYQQQAGQGGLNPMQNAGLELQRQTLMNPAYTAGYEQMRNLGAGLMGQGVAGNPFNGGQTAQAPQQPMPQMQQMPQQSNGRATFGQGMGMMGGLGFGNAPSAAMQPITQQQAAPQAQPDMQTIIDQMLAKYAPVPSPYGSRPPVGSDA